MRICKSLRPKLKNFDKFVIEDIGGYKLAPRRDLLLRFKNNFGAHISKATGGPHPNKWIVMPIKWIRGMPAAFINPNTGLTIVGAYSRHDMRKILNSIKTRQPMNTEN